MRSTLTVGVAAALAVAFLPASADAAVTSATCTTRSAAYSHLWTGSGEDYADQYEARLGQAPASDVTVSSTWLCQPYNFQSTVQEIIFTTTLGPNAGGVGGSSVVSRGCGTLYVRTVNGAVVKSVGNVVPSQIQSNGRFTCDWHVSVSGLTSGQTYFFNVVNQRMRYEWESGPQGAAYSFNVWLQVHSEVADHAASRNFSVPICFRTTPQLQCSFLGANGDPLGS